MISIHLMLWFNGLDSWRNMALSEISIHLMLWFNIKSLKSTKKDSTISIHLMLWFNKKLSRIKDKLLYFNTSYVMVQLGKENTVVLPKRFQYILCYGSTLRFLKVRFKDFKFQYILCYGST